MNLLTDIRWLQDQVKTHLVNCKDKPPWELGIRPTFTKREGDYIKKVWEQFNERWFWMEPIR